MRFAIHYGEQDLEEMTSRIVKGRTKRVAAAEASRQFAARNPHLQVHGKGAKGTIVIVPEGVEIEEGREVKLHELVGVPLLEQLDEALKQLGAAYEAAEQARAKEARQTLKDLDSPELKKMTRGNPELRQRIKATTAAANDELKTQPVRKKQNKAATAQARADLKELMERFRIE
jgi:hypothetical protein